MLLNELNFSLIDDKRLFLCFVIKDKFCKNWKKCMYVLVPEIYSLSNLVTEYIEI